MKDKDPCRTKYKMKYDREHYRHVLVKHKTRDKLAKLGIFGESYDNVVNRLMDFYIANHKEFKHLKKS